MNTLGRQSHLRRRIRELTVRQSGAPEWYRRWDAAALACLVALGVVIVLMLWPYSQYRFRFDPEELLKRYVDSERPATLARMHRELAVQIEKDRQGNWRIMQRLRRSLQLALILFLLEILSWLMSLADIEARPRKQRNYGIRALNSSGLIAMTNAISPPTANPTIVPAATPRQSTFCSLGVIATYQRHGKPYRILGQL